MTKLDEVATAIEGALPNQMKHLGPLLARAALKAMREPSEGMIDGIPDHLLGGYGFGDDCYSANAERIWEHMIDALLSESPR